MVPVEPGTAGMICRWERLALAAELAACVALVLLGSWH